MFDTVPSLFLQLKLPRRVRGPRDHHTRPRHDECERDGCTPSILAKLHLYHYLTLQGTLIVPLE
ncbi:MAG TPA: hypothetical protein VGA22_07690 [Gemmatimonadales bacterium]